MLNSNSARAIWAKLETARRPFLERAFDASSLTIPHLIPDNFDDLSVQTDRELRTPFQSVGSIGVETLASKMIFALLPPASPFYRYTVNEAAYIQRFGQESLQQALNSMVTIEQEVHREIETMNLRSVAFEHFEHLLVAGNGTLEILDDEDARFWPLSSYVVGRDPSSNLDALVLREEVSLANFDPKMRAAVMAATSDKNKETATIYTKNIRTQKDVFLSVQELGDGTVIPGTEGAFRGDEFPWIVNRWVRQAGEAYGRGHVERHIGNLRSLEGLMQAIVENAASAAHFIWLVNPNGRTRLRDLDRAPTGAFRPGVPDDVRPLTMGSENASDVRGVQDTISRLEAALNRVFLVGPGGSGSLAGRDRVTREEVLTLNQEIQEATGGAFTNFTPEFQEKVIMRGQMRKESRGELPALPKGIVKPKVITGFEGLARNQELNRVRQALGDLAALKPEALRLVSDRMAAESMFIGNGISTERWIISEEEEQQADQQEQQQQALTDLGPAAIGALTG